MNKIKKKYILCTSLTSWGIFVKPHENSCLKFHTSYTVGFIPWLIAGITITSFPHITLVAVQRRHWKWKCT